MKEKRNLAGMVVHFAFVFTLLIYGPLETYLMNAKEFWFALSSLLMPFGIVALGALALLMALHCVLPPKAGRCLMGLVSACTLGLYLQVNLLNPSYGALGAVAIRWEEYTAHAYLNAGIWIVFIVGAVIASLASKARFPRIASIAAGLLIVMQSSSLCVLLPDYLTSTARQEDAAGKVLSTEGMQQLGNADGSIMVVIVDTMDNLYFDKALEADPHALAYFDGFTRFTNCSGSCSTTGGAVPYMITGQYYTNEEPLPGFLNRHYADSPLLKALKDQGYDTRAYLSTSAYAHILAEYVDNGAEKQTTVTNPFPLMQAMLKLVLFRQAPEILKEKLYIEISAFNELQSTASVSNQYLLNDYHFYQTTLNQGITAASDQKTFRMIHLNGGHVPFRLTANAELSNEETSSLEQTRATLKILGAYLSEMKAQDVYDNTTIMLVADHSRYRDGDVIMLVKPPYTRGKMKENQGPVSHEDIHNTLLSLAGLNSVSYGENMFSVDENATRARRFYMYDIDRQFDDPDFLPQMWEIAVGGDISKPFYTGNVYAPGRTLRYKDYAPTAKIGQKYAYEEMEDYFSYGFFSWGDPKEKYLFGNMTQGQMFFQLEKVGAEGVNIVFDMLAWLPTTPNELAIQTRDGQRLYSHAFTQQIMEPIVVHVPKEAFDDKNMVVLDFLCPNATLSEDHRYMNFGFYSFTIEK